MIERLEEDAAFETVLVTREEEAIGILSGAWLGGRRGALICQSSGLANTFNAIGSLSKPWGLPFVALVNRRGDVGEHNRAQISAGYGMPRLLDALGVRNSQLDGTLNIQEQVSMGARSAFSTEDPYVFLLESSVEGEIMSANQTDRSDQHKCTELVLDITPAALIVSNLGTASYALMDVDDRDRNFYLNGAMGSTTPVGLGLAMAVDEQVTILDGDSSLLMSLGTLATVSEHDLSNLTIVVWDNSTFETTGGQPSLAKNTDFAATARNCGLAAWDVERTSAFKEAYVEAVEHDGSALVSCTVGPFAPDNHPSPDYAHSHIKHRFRIEVKNE